jgi:hypothetical protein
MQLLFLVLPSFQALFTDTRGSCRLILHLREYWHSIGGLQVLEHDWPSRRRVE